MNSKKVKCADCGKLFDPVQGAAVTQLVEVVRNGCFVGIKEKEVWLCNNCYWQGVE